MRSKIVTIEDVTKIVGMTNYIQALNLDREKLIYDTYESFGNKIKVHFHYEELPITVLINKEYRMMDMDCGCKPGLDYCPHIALAIMYLIEHEEEVNEMIVQLNSEYDLSFNQKLWNLYHNNQTKKKLTLDIKLKRIDYKNIDSYELQVKIGENKKYSLKRKLAEFLYVYQEQQGEVEFGEHFCYQYETYTFDEKDQNIIDFIACYVDSQNSVLKTFYGYHQLESKLDSIRLSKESLLQFMKLLENKPFIVEIGYYTYCFSGIEQAFPFTMNLESLGKNVLWKINTEELSPLIESYEYVMMKNKMYHVSNYKMLKLLVQNKKRDIIIQQEELPTFVKNVLPEIENRTTLDAFLQEKIIFKSPSVKYYFEKNEDVIIGKICLYFQGYEVNVFEDTIEWNGVYLKRDIKAEQIYKNELLNRNFLLQDAAFYLYKEDDIVLFLDEGLKTLMKQYDVYVSTDLKSMKVIRHVHAESSFSLGRDNILSYQFEIEHVEQQELASLLAAIQMKKKFYRLKDGSYMDLNNDALQQMSNIVTELEIEEGQGNLPLYKSLSLKQTEYIKLDNPLQTFLEQFQSYKNLEMNWDSENYSLLRDYQKIGIQWMLTVSKCGFSGILADEMGLGKSLQTIEYMKYKLKEKGTMLIIVPTSLIYNWEHELHRFGSNLNYCIINDTKNKRLSYFDHLKDYDVVLTTYGMLRQDIDYYKSYTFDTCIIDEAQNIKNANTETTKAIKQIQAKTRFALTGTPIENSVMELWSIFDFLMPGFLLSASKFKEKYNIKAFEENEELLKRLNEQISPFILRRKKKDVLKELPDKIENNIYIDMTEEQKKLYLAVLEKTKKEIENTIIKDGYEKSQILILSLLTRLRQICIDPRLYMETNIRSGKLDELIHIMNTSIQNKHKILLFSQFPSALKLVQKELQKNSITSYYLDGSTPSKTRMSLVDAFNQDATNVFLISLKAGGTGLNLTSADVVIHLDLWWNPQVENQATDRSHRIGQKHVVEVIRLIAKGTIEEKILELQQKKRNLSEQVIEGETRDQIILSKLTEEELLSILDNPSEK